MMRAVIIASAILAATEAGGARAGEADVVAVKFTRQAEGFRFDVTVRHADTGWDHYADRWEVVAEDGTVLGARELAHPHENEQPFTRSQSGIVIPAEIRRVTVRARDSEHGFGGREMTVELDARGGDG